ncbi:MAG: 3-isopropylmalate dehydratase [Emergencia sp.]
MENKFSGRVWKLPDDVDTDTIIPGRYGVLPTFKDMSEHCLEPLRPELAKEAKPGDIFVAGKNFGCGSSREFAPACINALGVRCIIAKSFARIFYRNGINNGMFLIESDDVYDICEEGDILTVDVNRSITVNGKTVPIREIPENLFAIIQGGGLVEHYRRLNEEKEAEGEE